MAEAEAIGDRVAALRTVLSEQQTRVIDFFRARDADGSGEIELNEFAAAMHDLGISGSKEELAALFATFDADGGGAISFKEFNKQLRAGRDQDLSRIQVKDALGNILDVNLAAGAAGEIEMSTATATGLQHEARRKRGSALHGSERLVASEDGPSVVQQLRQIMAENATRVIDLFRDWDEDRSGTITLKEFKRAIQALGYDASPADVAALFDSFDADGSKTIEMKELNKMLRKGADIALADELQAGAAGEIKLASLNLHRRTVAERLATALDQRMEPRPGGGLSRKT